MADQFAGRAIDIDAFQSAEFFPHEVDDVRAAHHANADAFAIENIAAQDRPPIEASQSKAALFGGDSQINRASPPIEPKEKPAKACHSCSALEEMAMKSSSLRESFSSGFIFQRDLDSGITSVAANRLEASGQGPWNAEDLHTRQGS